MRGRERDLVEAPIAQRGMSVAARDPRRGLVDAARGGERGGRAADDEDGGDSDREPLGAEGAGESGAGAGPPIARRIASNPL